MRVDWTTTANGDLRLPPESDLAMLYHENSKLNETHVASDIVQPLSKPFELFVASRGFHQFRNTPKTVLPSVHLPSATLAETILRRRSRRTLSQPLTLEKLGTVLRLALGPTEIFENSEIDVSQVLRAWPSAGGLFPLEAYVVAQAVSDLEPGLYHYNVLHDALEAIPSRAPADILREGFFWQEFATTASVAILLAGIFERTMAKYGERGYRLMLLDAGHAAQNLLLCAEATDLPSVAIGGFSDDQLAADLGLDGVGEAVLHATLLGGNCK
jgi:SagB-type dehydrogenase family enzyme